jgi:hypothetical protein
MALYQALTCKRRGDDQRSKVLSVTLDLEVSAFKAGSNVVLDQIRCGQHDSTS